MKTTKMNKTEQRILDVIDGKAHHSTVKDGVRKYNAIESLVEKGIISLCLDHILRRI